MTKSKKKIVIKSKKNNPDYFKTYNRRLWLTMILAIILSVLTILLLSISKLPDTQQLENPKFDHATKIYTADGVELGRYFRKNRDWVHSEDISPHLINALIATEDERYHRHSGIDTKGTIRAIVYMGNKGGASTITQQLARLLFINKSRNFVKRVFQKFREWIIAIRIEKRYTKEEIIAMYLNKFDFLYDSDGVAAAAKTYFGKNQKDLNIEEAAMLIGMLKNPRIFSPYKYPERAKKRRMVVLNQMRKNKFLTREAYDSLKVLDLDMSRFMRQEDSEGLAPYFRSELTKWVKNLLNDNQYFSPNGSPYNIYTDGLKIYTTLDSKIQTYAEQSVQNNIKRVQSKYWSVWKNKNPWNYNASDAQKKLRKKSLNNAVRQSSRFQKIKDRYMSKTITDISANVQNAPLRDIDITRMIQIDKEPSYVNLLSSQGNSTKLLNGYKKIMASTQWPLLKKQWIKMEKEVRSSFNKKVYMKVFAHNAKGSKDTLMTPLDSIKYHHMHMQSGMLAIEPTTGYVKAWVGGIDHKYFQYDHVNSNRQVGSTFKPFIYATAIFNSGISPCWKVKDQQYSIPAHDKDFGLLEKWEPNNSSGKFTGEEMTLFEALKQSKNSVSVWLMKEMGNTEVIRALASNFGLPKDKIPSQPSICLGTPELSLYDMTSAYSVFANNGIYNNPIFVTKIETRDGKLIYNGIPDQRKVLPEDYNYTMVKMLQYAASSVSGRIHSELGGKTGTTNDYVDGWFMGITPELVVGTWVGGEHPWIRFLKIEDGQGAVMARPAFLDLMHKIENDPNLDFSISKKFKIPQNMNIETDCAKYDEITNQNSDEDDFDDEDTDQIFDEE